MKCWSGLANEVIALRDEICRWANGRRTHALVLATVNLGVATLWRTKNGKWWSNPEPVFAIQVEFTVGTDRKTDLKIDIIPREGRWKMQAHQDRERFKNPVRVIGSPVEPEKVIRSLDKELSRWHNSPLIEGAIIRHIARKSELPRDEKERRKHNLRYNINWRRRHAK